MGANINGPSLIRVPGWISAPLGQYYLYFAHHDGRYIRMAFADAIEGPWRMHTPGVLPLTQSTFAGHIASPDVHVDDESQRVHLYFHGANVDSMSGGHQTTRVASSNDGLSFTARDEDLGTAYFRIFRYDGWVYALAMPGIFYRSKDGLTNFERGPKLFDNNMRHSAVTVQGNVAHIFYTDVGDCPEQIRHTTMALHGDWMRWQTTTPTTVLRPELSYEGADEPLVPSVRGLVEGPVNQLRDPCLFYDDDGAGYLLYSVAGEAGIAIAALAF